MITIDTSVLVAILLEESGWERLEQIVLDNKTIISSVSIVETYLVLTGRMVLGAQAAIEETIKVLNIRVVEFCPKHIQFAQTAFEKYGKGRHPAKLNFGDCMVYATAKFTSTPLLYVGDDFAKTDIESVDWR